MSHAPAAGSRRWHTRSTALPVRLLKLPTGQVAHCRLNPRETSPLWPTDPCSCRGIVSPGELPQPPLRSPPAAPSLQVATCQSLERNESRAGPTPAAPADESVSDTHCAPPP